MKRIATAKIEEVEEMLEIPAYGAASAKAPLAPFFIERRRPGPHDVLVEILSVIVIFIRPAASGADRSCRWCPATRSSAR